MLSDGEEALTTKFLEGGLGRSQRRFSDEDRRLSFGRDARVHMPVLNMSRFTL